jgi:hypothetical protein
LNLLWDGAPNNINSRVRESLGDDQSLIKYPPRVMERMFDGMFTGAGAEESKPKKSLLGLHKLKG